MLWGVATGALEADRVVMWLPQPVGTLLLEQGLALPGAALMRLPSTLEQAGVMQLQCPPALAGMQLLSTLTIVTVCHLQAELAMLHL